MSASVPPPSNWPLRPDSRFPRRDLAAEILELRRYPARGKLTGLSGAVADWLGIDVLLVRTLVVISSLSAGVGVLGYLAGWAITRDANTGQAPLDKLGDRWRQLSPRAIIGWAAGAILLFGFTFGSILGFGWLPLIIIALTVWTGLRLPPTKPRPTHHQFTAAAPAAAALPPGAYAVPQPARPTWVITLATICVAALAGGAFYEADPYNIVRPVAVVLLIIGLGLLVAARRGLAVGLVAAGLVSVVGMGGLAVVAPLAGQDPRTVSHYNEVYYFEELAEVPGQMSFDTQSVLVDIGLVSVDSTREIHLDALDSSVTLLLPTQANTQVLVDYTDALVMAGDQIEVGTGSTTLSYQPYPGEPTLTIHINATTSRIEVPQ